MTSTPYTHADDQPVKSQTHVEIYTDGSCIGNPGFGGYGAVIMRKDRAGTTVKRRDIQGSADTTTTNNRMEITAACEALEALGKPSLEPITVYSDATLIPSAMNGWITKWKANGWTKAKRQPVENVDLWKRLEKAAEGRTVTFKWIRGHNGIQYNEEADRLAYAAARKAEANLQ